jgi:two-component system sensor histidine kinase HydH
LIAMTADRLQDLHQIIQTYNQVTERLQLSHETLTREVQRLQQELADANAALQRSRRLAALGEMAAGIAHEVRNPLAMIGLYARLMDQDLADRPEQAATARKIAAAVRSLDAVVHDVLAFAAEMKPRRAPTPVHPLLERAVETVGVMIGRHDIRVLQRVDPPDLTACLDVELMHRALVNLVRNAAQAMERGGTLTLQALERKAVTRIVVRDTGPGISEQAIDRIFNPFFTTRPTGTGLGLAIVHRIIDAHGGAIAVHNDPESGGAVFTLSIPAESAAPPPRIAAPAAAQEC